MTTPSGALPRKRPGASPLAALAIGLVVLVAAVLLLPVLLFSGSYVLFDLVTDKCTDAERAAFAEIRHPVPLEPREPAESAGCDAMFDTDEPAGRILDHYQAELLRAGWTIDRRFDPDPEATTPPPPPEDAEDRPMPVEVATGGSLTAHRGTWRFSLEYSPGWVSRPGEDPVAVQSVWIWLDDGA